WKEQSASAQLQVKQVNPQHIDSRIHAGRVSGQITVATDAHRQSAHIDLKDRAFNLTANVMRDEDAITLEQFMLRRNQSQLTGHGKLDPSGKRVFQLTAQLSNFNIAEFIQAPASNLNAVFHASGQLSPEPSGTLDYTIQKSRLGKSAVTGVGQLGFNGWEQLKGKAELTIGSNRLSLHGDLGATNDAYQLTINAPALEQLGFGLSGDVQANVSGKKQRAARDIVLKLASRRLQLSGNHQIFGFSAEGQMHRDAVTLNLTAAQYVASGTSRLKDLNVRMNGALSDHRISASALINDDIPLQIEANGRITMKTQLSALRWQGQLSKLSSSGKIPIRLQAPTSLSISADSLTLDHAVLAISDGFLSIEHLAWTPKSWKTQGHFSGIAIYPGNPQYIPPLALHMGGNWDFISDNRLKGHLHLHRERGDWQLPGDIPQLAGLERFQLHVTAQRDAIASSFELISQHLGNAKARLNVPIKHSNQRWSVADNAPLTGDVSAQINHLKWLDSLMGAGISMNGRLQAQAHIGGTLSKPDIQGTVTGKELSILLLEQGIDLQQGNLSATFQQADLVIDRLHFVSPHPPPPQDRLLKNVQLNHTSGSLTVAGHLGLTGNESRLNITLSELPVAHKTNYWIIASGSGQARLQSKRLSLTGHLTADAGLLLQPPENRPELSDDIVFTNVAPDPAQQKLSLDLDMNLNLGERFFIRASGLEGRLAGQLQILDDKKRKLKVNGTIAAQDTTFKAYGQDLTVRRGIVSFQGPLDDPALSVLAVREGLQVEAGVEILGSVRHPQVRLVSTPNVSETEKLSWIVLGRKPDPGGLDATALVAAAGSILGGQSGSGITEQITRTFGLDELTIKQAGVGSSLSGQIGVVGKRLSSRAYLSYERSLATTTMGITKLTYNLTPRITIVTQAGEDNAADLFYTLQFD
ncbi:MAG: translocation/assembly module TamB domain-containing protein, partial [Nitrosomonas sp.]|nr:translocation/assembly module TamB domain-containing protein [Nitrosomonas sp.]